MALQKWPNRGASNATPAGFMSTRRTQRRSFFIPSPSQIAEPSFVAVDFETANRMGGVSACQVAMVKVCDGQIVDRLNTLIRPPKGGTPLSSPICMASLQPTSRTPPAGPTLPTPFPTLWMG